MKKLTFFLVVAVMFTLVGCGSKSSEAEAVLGDVIDITIAFADNLEKASDASGVAAAIDQYTADMKKMIPRIKEMQAKYPDLDMKGGKLPDEFKEFDGKFTDMNAKMMKAFTKAASYMSDPKVLKAQQDMVNAMMELTKK